MKNKFVYQYGGQNGICFYHAVSVLRAALGYDTPYPETLTKPEPVYTEYIVQNAGDLFPDHEVSVYCKDTLKNLAHNYRGAWPEDKDMGGFLWMYDYSTKEEYLMKKGDGGLWSSHTVIGSPSLHTGMVGFYAIRILVE